MTIIRSVFVVASLLIIAGCRTQTQPPTIAATTPDAAVDSSVPAAKASVASALAGAMTAGPSDQVIADEERRFFSGVTTRDVFTDRTFHFTEFFKVEQVEVEDRALNGNECMVIAVVTFKVRKAYVANSMLMSAWYNVIGTGGGRVGERKSIRFQLKFRKYVKGWRLE